MGFRFRKSIKLPGGFRINASKSGIGYSWGAKGYRVTKTAKGTTRTTVSIPGTGISYVQESKLTPKEQATKENCSDEKPIKRRSGCLLQILAVPFILLVIGVIVTPKDKIDDNQGGNWSVSQPADSSSKQEGNQTGNVNTKPNIEEVKDKASLFLSESFQLNLIGLEDKAMHYEMKVTSEGISDREDQSQVPENWNNFQLYFVSAQARMADEIEVESDKAMLILVDSNDDMMLSVKGGIITYNKYKEETVEQEKPNETITKPTERTVWVTSSGKKYHYSSTCSGMKNPSSISLSTAKSKGYTACSKCG